MDAETLPLVEGGTLAAVDEALAAAVGEPAIGVEAGERVAARLPAGVIEAAKGPLTVGDEDGVAKGVVEAAPVKETVGTSEGVAAFEILAPDVGETDELGEEEGRTEADGETEPDRERVGKGEPDDAAVALVDANDVADCERESPAVLVTLPLADGDITVEALACVVELEGGVRVAAGDADELLDVVAPRLVEIDAAAVNVAAAVGDVVAKAEVLAAAVDEAGCAEQVPLPTTESVGDVVEPALAALVGEVALDGVATLDGDVENDAPVEAEGKGPADVEGGGGADAEGDSDGDGDEDGGSTNGGAVKIQNAPPGRKALETPMSSVPSRLITAGRANTLVAPAPTSTSGDALKLLALALKE